MKRETLKEMKARIRDEMQGFFQIAYFRTADGGTLSENAARARYGRRLYRSAPSLGLQPIYASSLRRIWLIVDNTRGPPAV